MKQLAFLLLWVVCACTPPALAPQEAARDATLALQKGDRRLIGVYGFAVETPGADDSARERHGVRMIEGTSDTPIEGKDLEFNNRAREYARRYNQVIIAGDH